MKFSRQEYWSGLPFPSPGDLPNLGIKPVTLASPALTSRFFTTSATYLFIYICVYIYIYICMYICICIYVYDLIVLLVPAFQIMFHLISFVQTCWIFLKNIYIYIFDIFALGLSSSTWDLLLRHTDSLVVGLVASQHVESSSLTMD